MDIFNKLLRTIRHCNQSAGSQTIWAVSIIFATFIFIPTIFATFLFWGFYYYINNMTI
jgi:hypothetical protein